MTAAPATVPDISPDSVVGLAERAQEAEGLRRLPAATVDDFVASGLADLLVPLPTAASRPHWAAILDPVRRMAHGCASSAWTLGFYILHNWMMALSARRQPSRCARSWPPRPGSPAGGVGRRRPLPRSPAAADYQPRACGRADTGNENVTNCNDLIWGKNGR
jgi:3-hydroxy-9,10-secoandrosta-1,3,5(10)-triene-9,17-dione monooxygenase